MPSLLLQAFWRNTTLLDRKCLQMVVSRCYSPEPVTLTQLPPMAPIVVLHTRCSKYSIGSGVQRVAFLQGYLKVKHIEESASRPIAATVCRS